MSTRVETDPPSQPATLAAYPPNAAVAIDPFDPDDRFGGHALPNDHPAWMRDTVSISQRTRALLTKLKPVAVRVIAFWEHRVRSIFVAGAKLSVDTSGSYRLE